MKFRKKIVLLFNNAKLIKELEDKEDIIKKKDALISEQTDAVKEYEIFTNEDNLLVRIRDYEHLLEHYHCQKREYKAEILKLKQEKLELKQQLLEFKNKPKK